jgi:CubicO group peptidase (beta-lactamase class C family)
MLLSIQSCHNSGKINNNLNYSGYILFDKQTTDMLFNTIHDYPDQSEFAIGLIVGDTTEYYGLKKSNSEVVTVDNRISIFEIGSISKVFLSSLLVQSIQDSLITLNEYLRAVLPFEISSYGYGNQEVKIIHLANHTSGIEALPEGLIKDYQYDEKDDDELTLVKNYLANHTKFKWPPGIKYEYSNLGMALLGLTISNLYNISYEALVKKNITDPFDMQNTTVQLNGHQKEMLVKGLNQFGTEAPMLVSGLYSCSGGLKSNVVDMVKFIKANMKEDYKHKMAHETTFDQDEIYHVGLGWHYSIRGNSRVYFHHGGTFGYSSGIAFDKNSKVGIVLLTNRSALLKKIPDITEFMYKIFGDIIYKYRLTNTKKRADALEEK